jgi:hypothetical protein
MALSMDEQRMLAEIEKRLAADDPGLASCLSTFRRPGPGTVLRSPRARIIGSLFTVLLVVTVSLMVYAMIPFRAHTVRNSDTPSPGNPAVSAAAGTHSPVSQQTTFSAAGPSSSVTRETNQPTTRSSAARAQDAKAKPTSASAAPGTKP